MSAEMSGAMRDAIIDAISTWGGSLEPSVAELNTLPNTDTAVQQALLGLCEVAAAVVFSVIDAKPDLIGNPEWAESVVSTLFETISEEGLAQGAAKHVAYRKAEYYKNLLSNPEVAASARKFGLQPESVARGMADDFVEQMTEAIRSVTPLALRVAQEPPSVADLEKRLAAATAGAGRSSGAAGAVGASAPAAAGGPAAEWYADPMGRHQYRYWDGATWTEHVADDGVQSDDPLTPGV